MIVQQIRLFACAVLAGRRQARGAHAAEIPALPATEREVTETAAQWGMCVPAACMPGVIANLALLGRHAAILRDGGSADG